jgi:hypothetical protein
VFTTAIWIELAVFVAMWAGAMWAIHRMERDFEEGKK